MFLFRFWLLCVVTLLILIHNSKRLIYDPTSLWSNFTYQGWRGSKLRSHILFVYEQLQQRLREIGADVSDLSAYFLFQYLVFRQG